jgi:transposase InsO family protein
MATENPIWGEERIANELLLKLGLKVSPRTVRKYMPRRPPGRPRGDQRWSTFLRNHAHSIVACDFFVAVTATFRLLYVFVDIEHGSRRLVRVAVLRSPPHSPKANAICEQVIGTMRRECLDWLIPLSESHLRSILRARVGHYNGGRPHMALGPGVPDPPSQVVPPAPPPTHHRIGERLSVRARSVLGGLHHEYQLAPA